MCGISGIMSIGQRQKIDFEILKKMNSQIVHRGPDDEGYLMFDIGGQKVKAFGGKDTAIELKNELAEYQSFEAELGFGFRRLPTLDLSESGHQPMYDKELGLGIIFNGEIYNHNRLRDELLAKGYAFFSGSDTEVILKSYHAWGDDCVSHLNGMWAFAIWDTRNQRLFMSRDRYGIKPFYYLIEDDLLYWGSEIKQLLTTPAKRSYNYGSIWRSTKINSLLNYGDETFFKEIKALKPGHNLIVENKSLKFKEYYKVKGGVEAEVQPSFEEAAEKYRQLFLDSLSMTVQSEVPVGAMLSGGLDSSAIVSCGSKMLSYQMQCFSTYYPHFPQFDERDGIAKVAQDALVDSLLIAPSAKDAMAWWQKATWLNDLPVNTGFVSQYAVMQSAHKRGVKVLLSGLGVDEIFGSYRHAGYRYFADLLKGLKLSKFGKEFISLNQQDLKQLPMALGKSLLSLALSEKQLAHLEANYYEFEPFSKDFVKGAKSEAEGKMMQLLADSKGNKFDSMLLNLMGSSSLKTLLHYEDRMSMGHSVEARTPYLDYRLVDFVFSLPASYKLRPPLKKALHTEAVKNCIPREILEKKDKSIFGSPLSLSWLRGPMKDFSEDILYSQKFRKRGIWDLPKIHSRWQRYLKGSAKDHQMLFNVLALEIWFRSFEEL